MLVLAACHHGADVGAQEGSGGASTSIPMPESDTSTTEIATTSTSTGLGEAGSSSTGEPSPCTDVHEGSLTLDGQTEVDSSLALREVTGSLVITGDVQSLASLSCLSRVGADLRIQGTADLADLTGLFSLSYVGRRLDISHNENLESLDGLDALGFVPYISIQGNALRSLKLDELQAVEQLQIGDCCSRGAGEPELEDLSGLGSLISVDLVDVCDLPKLVELSGLQAFADRGGSVIGLDFRRNTSLDPGLVEAVGLDLEASSVMTCGNLGQDPERVSCLCGPPP